MPESECPSKEERKKQRKKNRSDERTLVKQILDYLKQKGLVCKRNNSGMMFSTYKGKGRAIKIGEAGFPDIEGMTKEGLYFGIEVKTASGKLSPAQVIVGQKIQDSNGIWFVARSLEDVTKRGL